MLARDLTWASEGKSGASGKIKSEGSYAEADTVWVEPGGAAGAS